MPNEFWELAKNKFEEGLQREGFDVENLSKGLFFSQEHSLSRTTLVLRMFARVRVPQNNLYENPTLWK